ncbi:MAG: sulfite exporter TauE/SafE family protein [Chloroflexi bacterium]|nr:sulfite exporter TauE/SafE family protein [Chloroflexota bacterium]
MSADIIAAAVVIAFLAALCMSTTGFGFALTMTPLLTLAWDVKPAIATSVMLSLMTQWPLIVEVRSHVVPSRVVVLLAGFLLGLPVGLVIFDRLDSDSLKLFVAGTVAVASLALFASPALQISDRAARPLALIAGVFSGTIGSSTSMNGPPVVLYLLGRHPDIEAFRATILSFFLPTAIVMVIAFAILGRIDEDVLITGAACLPAMVLGILSGIWLRRRLDPDRFRHLALAVLVVSSAGILISVVA